MAPIAARENPKTASAPGSETAMSSEVIIAARVKASSLKTAAAIVVVSPILSKTYLNTMLLLASNVNSAVTSLELSSL